MFFFSVINLEFNAAKFSKTFLTPSEGHPSYWPLQKVIWEPICVNSVITLRITVPGMNNLWRWLAKKKMLQTCAHSCHITNSYILCPFDIQWFDYVAYRHKFCCYFSSLNHSAVTLPYQKSTLMSEDSLHFQFHPNLSAKVFQAPRLAGLIGSCNCKL